MRVFSTSFSLASTCDERVPDRRDQRAELLLAARQIDGGFAVHVADLLVGQLQEFIGAGLQCRSPRAPGRRRAVDPVGSARLREASSQPAAKPATSAPTDNQSNFQYSECNSDYRIVSRDQTVRDGNELRNWLPRASVYHSRGLPVASGRPVARMTRVLPVVNAPVTLTVDGFGRRTTGIDSETGDRVELLDLAAEPRRARRFRRRRLASASRALRPCGTPRTCTCAASIGRRPIASSSSPISRPGWRLSELLDASRAAGIPVDITVVIGLLRQLLPAVALYGRHNRDAAIGALGVERLIVTPQARLVIAEHAFGPALEKLNLATAIACGATIASPCRRRRCAAAIESARAMRMALGVVALVAAARARRSTGDEYPSQIAVAGRRRCKSRTAIGTSRCRAFFSSWLRARCSSMCARLSVAVRSAARV